MYWYISFLRPSPVSVSLAATGILITPQVANDLRTELRYEATELYYVWQRVHPSNPPVEKEELLTRYLPPESTYRSLSVPLPIKAKPGEKWRLGLRTSAGPTLLELSGEDVGVIGVWSEAIEFKRDDTKGKGPVRGINGKEKGKGKERDEGQKQSRISREFSLPGGGELKMVEQTSFDLDKKIWDSGLALSSWLWRYLPESRPGKPSAVGQHRLAGTVFDMLRRRDACEALRVLELGSGTGLVSIALALALKAFRNRDVMITATDLGPAMSLMEGNIALNEVDVRLEGPSSVEARVLDWEQPLPAWLEETGSWPELIIAADVTYNTASFPSLVRTIISLLDPPSPKTRPMLLLSYKQRDPAERELWEMLKEKGIEMHMIDQVRGCEEDGQVEIWVGRSG